jgi:hypothetical protein
MQVYVRSTHRLLWGQRMCAALEIGTVEVKRQHRGKGRFTLFLHSMELLCTCRHHILYVENVFDARFQAFFRKRGYIEYKPAGDCEGPLCFYKRMR